MPLLFIQPNEVPKLQLTTRCINQATKVKRGLMKYLGS